MEPGQKGGFGVMGFWERRAGFYRREINFLVLEGRKAEFDGFVEFLWRGKVYSKFKAGFWVLIVLCG